MPERKLTRLEEVVTRMAAVQTELLEIEALEAPTEEDGTRGTALIEEFDTLEAEREPLQTRFDKLAKVRSAALDPKLVEPAVPDVLVRTKRDPFDSLRAVVGNGHVSRLETDDLRGRALDAIEYHSRSGAENPWTTEGAEKATRMVQADDTGNLARHILIAGSDEYHAAFRNIMRHEGEVNALEPEHQAAMRAALSLTGANGGFLIPVTLDPTINLTNSGSANPFRQISQVKSITTNFWEGVTSAGVNAAWLGEGSVVGDNTPTLAQPIITPQKAAAWVFGSYEILSDSDFATQFPALLTDAKDRLEEAAFATGAGSGGVPKGIITAATTTVTTAGAAAYAIADVYALQAAVPPRFRAGNKLKIVANVAIINKTRQFDTAGGSSYWTNLGAGQPEQVLGADLYESTTMVGTTTTGSKIAVAGDFQQYLIVDRVGMSVMYEPMVKDSATARPTGQAGWFAYWRVGADALVPGAFRVLTVQ